MTLLKRCCIFLLCLTNAIQLTQNQPVSGAAAGAGNDDFVSHKDEIVLVEDVVRYTDIGTNSTATLITLSDPMMFSADINAKQLDALEKVEQLVHHQDNVDNESTLDTSAGASDDLIFLAVKKPTHLQEQQQSQQALQQQQHHHHHHHQHRGIHEIDLLTVDDLFASSSSCSSASCESPDATDDGEDDTVPREIERLQTDDALSLSSSSSLSPAGPPRPSIDMRDFVALIPAAEVKSIVANYYSNDAEVQRAYAYLSGRDFLVLKQRIIAIPEMSAFLRYLNASGLDVVGFFYTLTNLTSKPAENAATQLPAASLESLVLNSSTASVGGNDILKNSILTPTATAKTIATATATAMQINSVQPTTIATSSHSTMTTTATTTAAAESLNGLHGLVDSILDILPQDQILSTFFDKLESNEQFSKLVDNVGSPEFAKILHNMENSVPLRNLIFTLHNNGIYITRIVDSLKAYFFLGTF